MIEMTVKKSEIRAKMISLIRSHKKLELNKFSEQICDQLFHLLIQKKIRKIGVFAPLYTEPNIWFFITHTQAETYFPKVIENQLRFAKAKKSEDLTEGTHGVREPTGDIVLHHTEDLEALLVPGLAFDVSGNRLGRGMGFYDRFLSRVSQQTLKIGVCFPFQVVAEIPAEPHDQKVDFVLSG